MKKEEFNELENEILLFVRVISFDIAMFNKSNDNSSGIEGNKNVECFLHRIKMNKQEISRLKEKVLKCGNEGGEFLIQSLDKFEEYLQSIIDDYL